MATCLDIIARSLRLVGVVSAGETQSAVDAETGLEALNNLLESLSISRPMAPGATEEVFTLTAGQTDYTIGVGQDFNTDLPVSIDESSFVRVGGLDYPISLMSLDEWSEIPLKHLSSFIPSNLYYKRNASNGELRFYPAPGSGVEFHCASWKPLTRYAALTDEMSLPYGYERMIGYILASELAPEYGREVSATVARLAYGARRQIKAANLQVPKLETGIPGNSRFNVLAGMRG
jgi:hypothetical protein